MYGYCCSHAFMPHMHAMPPHTVPKVFIKMRATKCTSIYPNTSNIINEYYTPLTHIIIDSTNLIRRETHNLYKME